MAIARHDDRHRYGRHYTPEHVANLLAAFAVKSSECVILDPSCGDGRLIKAALEMKRLLNGQPVCKTESKAEGFGHQVFGFDLMKSAVRDASRYGATVAVADFFEVNPGGSFRTGGEFKLPTLFDSIIGNPPYIRQEIIGSEKKARVRELLSNGGNAAKRQEDPGDWFEGFGPQVTSPMRESGERAPSKQWSSRSDIYVYFFAHAERFLKAGGRLVFITASSWLDVGYGLELRQFLLDHFRVIAIIESAAESFFEDASVNTAITVLEKEGDQARRIENEVRFVQLRRPLTDIVGGFCQVGSLRFAREIETASDSHNESLRIRNVSASKLLSPQAGLRGKVSQGGPYRPPVSVPGRRPPKAIVNAARDSANRDQSNSDTWGRYLRADDVFFRVLDRACARLLKLENVASLRYGVKTGANDFFYVKGVSEESNVALRKLTDLAFVRRGVTTGANEFFYLRKTTCGDGQGSGEHEGSGKSLTVPPVAFHTIASGSSSTPSKRPSSGLNSLTSVLDGSGRQFDLEDEFLTPVLFSLKELPRIEVDAKHVTRFLFDCSLDRSTLAGTAAIKYIEAAESEGIHLRPTCRARNPWYSALRGTKAAPMIFPSKVGERWVVAINKAGLFEDKKLYGVFPADEIRLELLAALLNSTWVRYYVEATCRQLTGAQAIADIDVAVAEQVLLPDPRAIEAEIQAELISALATLSGRDIKSIFHEVHCEDRRTLDDAVLRSLGFTDAKERAEVLDDLYCAATELVKSRLERSKGGHSPKVEN